MAVVFKGAVTQSSDGLTITFTDSSTGITGLISRTLVIYNSAGTVLQTINMGTALTATYGITTDLFLSFVETIVDSTGTYPGTVNYLSTQFYALAQVQLAAQLQIGCNPTGVSCTSMVKARECVNAASTSFLTGDAITAQLLITQADYYILNPTYS